jgi:hypothetical protein
MYIHNDANGFSQLVFMDNDAIEYMKQIRPYVVSYCVQMQIDLLLGGSTRDELAHYKGCTLRKEDNPKIPSKVDPKTPKVPRKKVQEGDLHCKFCDHKTAKDRNALKKHMFNHLSGTEEEKRHYRFICPECSYTCMRKEHMTSHFKKHMGMDLMPQENPKWDESKLVYGYAH